MSLSKRIADDRDARLMDETAAQLEADREVAVRQVRRIEIVTKTLTTVARSLDEPCTPISGTLALPKYFEFGDFVVSVQLFERVNDDPTSDEPQLVVVQHYVSLVGVDKRSETLENVRVGMLAWLRYESIYKAVTRARSYIDFDMDRVKALLRGESRVGQSAQSGIVPEVPSTGKIPTWCIVHMGFREEADPKCCRSNESSEPCSFIDYDSLQ